MYRDVCPWLALACALLLVANFVRCTCHGIHHRGINCTDINYGRGNNASHRERNCLRSMPLSVPSVLSRADWLVVPLIGPFNGTSRCLPRSLLIRSRTKQGRTRPSPIPFCSVRFKLSVYLPRSAQIPISPSRPVQLSISIVMCLAETRSHYYRFIIDFPVPSR